MKNKRTVRFLSLLTAFFCLLPMSGLLGVSAEDALERNYQKAPTNGLYLTYDESAGVPRAYYHKTLYTGIADGGNATYTHYTTYLTGEDCATPVYGSENGFLKIKPDVVGKPMAIRVKFGKTWDIMPYEICKYTSLCYKVIGDDSVIGKEMHAGALAGDDEGNLYSGKAYFDYPIAGSAGAWNLSTQETVSRIDGNTSFQFWSLDQKNVEFVLYLPALANADAYYVVDYIGWTASETDTNSMKAEHDEWVKTVEAVEAEKIFSATYRTRAERGIARENVLYFDGHAGSFRTSMPGMTGVQQLYASGGAFEAYTNVWTGK